MEITRVKTGIDGFDELIQGGFPKGSSIMVSGAPGTGKSIFGLEYIYKGAENGERGVYVSLLQKISELLKQSGVFGWDFTQFLRDNTVEMLEVDMLEFDPSKILKEIRDGGYERVVIDSISNIIFHPVSWKDIKLTYIAIREIEDMIPDPKNPIVASRIIMERFLTELKKIGATSIVISESGEERDFNRDIIPESLVDGVIYLNYNLMGPTTGRNLIIQKMRSTKHSEVIHPIEFIEGVGIRVMKP